MSFFMLWVLKIVDVS